MNPQSLHIDEPEAYELASAIAERTGRSLTAVVVEALRREKDRVATPPAEPVDMEKVRAILAHAHSLPDLTPVSAQEIMDDLYDENGMWR